MKSFNAEYLLKQLQNYKADPQESLINVICEGSSIALNNLYDLMIPDLISKDEIKTKARGGAIEDMFILMHPIGIWLASIYIELYYELFVHAAHDIAGNPRDVRDYILNTRLSIMNNLNGRVNRMKFVTGLDLESYNVKELYEYPWGFYNYDDDKPKRFYPDEGKINSSESFIGRLSVMVNNKLKSLIGSDKLDDIVKINNMSLAEYDSIINLKDWVYLPIHELKIKTKYDIDITSDEYVKSFKKLLAFNTK